MQVSEKVGNSGIPVIVRRTLRVGEPSSVIGGGYWRRYPVNVIVIYYKLMKIYQLGSRLFNLLVIKISRFG